MRIRRKAKLLLRQLGHSLAVEVGKQGLLVLLGGGFMTAVLTALWGYLSGLPWLLLLPFVVMFVLGIPCLVWILVLLTKGHRRWPTWSEIENLDAETTTLTQEVQPTPTPPTEPILEFLGLTTKQRCGVHSSTGRSFHLNCLVIRNVQFSSLTIAHNVVATFKYFYLGAHQFTDEGLWLVDHEDGRWELKRSVSLESNKAARLIVVGQFPPDELDKKLFAISVDDEKELTPKGDWTVEFSIQSQNCAGIKGQVIIKMFPHVTVNAEVHAAKLPAASPQVKATIS